MSRILKKLKNIKLDPAMLILFIFAMLFISRLAVKGLKDAGNTGIVLIILIILTFGFSGVLWCRLRGLPRFKLSDKPYLSSLRLARPRLKHATATVGAVFALISGCLLLSINFSGESSLTGSFFLYDVFISKYNATTVGAIGLMIAYAALPAIGEEFIFRGIICSEYDKYGAVCSITLNSFWFSLIYFNFEKITVYLFAGLVLSLLLYATRSLYTVTVAHFAYNLFCIFVQPYVTEYYVAKGSVGIVVIVLIILLLLSAAVFCAGASKLYEEYAKEDKPSKRKPIGRRELIKNYRSAIVNPYACLCIAVFLAVTVIQIFVK